MCRRAAFSLIALLLALGSLAPLAGLATARNSSVAQGANRFASEQFDYVLAWEAPWIETKTEVDQLYERVILTDGSRVASFIALATKGRMVEFDDPVEALDTYVDNQIDQARDVEVLDEDPEATAPWTALAYTGGDGPKRALVQVFTLHRGEAYLVSILESPADEFDEALGQAAAGITLDGDPFVAQGVTAAADGGNQDDATSDRTTDEPDEADVRSGTVASYRGGPGRSGEQPGPAPDDEPGVIWSFETGDDFVGAGPAAVSVEDGLVFTSSNAVYAIDLQTGKEVWSYKADMGFVSPLALADGVLYAGGEDGAVYAFESKTGDVLWRTQVSAGMPVNGGPLVADDVLYVTSWDGRLSVLETRTGKVLGSESLGGMSVGQPAYADGYLVFTAPVTSFNGVIAIDAESGKQVWTFEVASAKRDPSSTVVTIGPSVYAVPAIVDGVVYVGSDGGVLYALDLETGKELWSVDTGAAVAPGPAVQDGVVYVANGESTLAAYDAGSGAERWSVDVDGRDLGGVTVTRTGQGEPLILVGDGTGTLHAFDADGQPVYAAQVAKAAIALPPTVVDGVIYVSARDGAVHALAA